MNMQLLYKGDVTANIYYYENYLRRVTDLHLYKTMHKIMQSTTTIDASANVFVVSEKDLHW